MAAALFQIWYNFARFGSAFKAISFETSAFKPESIGGFFNLGRIPSTFSNYFGFSFDNFLMMPPYARPLIARYSDDSIFFGWKESVLSLSLGSPWLLLGALFGLSAFHRSALRPTVLLLGGCFGIQVVLILSFYFVTWRYSLEIVPFLCALYALALASPARIFAHKSIKIALPLVTLLSVFTTNGSTLYNAMIYGNDMPYEYSMWLRRVFMPTAVPPSFDGCALPLNALAPLRSAFPPEDRFRPKTNQTWDSLPLMLGGYEYQTGIGLHATSSITFAVPDGAVRLQGITGPSDHVRWCAAVSFYARILNENDRVLFETNQILNDSPATAFSIDLHGTQEVTLQAVDEEGSIYCDHSVWVDVAFILPPESCKS